MKKKILFIFSLLILAVATQVATAQVQTWTQMYNTIPSSAGGNPGTIGSAACYGLTAAYLYVRPVLPYRWGAFQIKATRISASMNGSALLQGSVDGLNYFALSTSDSIHIANGATYPGDRAIILNSTSTAYPSNGLPYPYYRLKLVNYNTADSMTVVGWFYGRQ